MNELNIFKIKLFIGYLYFYICGFVYVYVFNYYEIFFDNIFSFYR